LIFSAKPNVALKINPSHWSGEYNKDPDVKFNYFSALYTTIFIYQHQIIIIMEQVYFHNKELLQQKIKEIKSQGLDKLHVVSDFDRTLTKCFLNGKKIPSAIALIREGGYLTKDYPKKAFALFDKYHPIEIDDSLDYDFKFKKMQEWWKSHEKLLIKSGMHQKVIDDIIEKYPKIFRDGAFDFLDFLSSHNIPLLILSSGIGNLIEGYLKKENKLTPNIHILSNTFNFNSQGYATGYKNGIIHVMNKSETKIENKKYRDLISQRNNVILLGDSLGDLGMVNDLDTNLIIKIGFLNEDVENKLELYKSKFDVVITKDGSMNYVNKLLDKLNGAEKYLFGIF
jgi:5'-nucleotidase